jgi:hypothetical protein
MICRIPAPPFVVIVQAGQIARLKSKEKTMPQYLINGYLADDFDPSQADPAMGDNIHALNKEMIAAGVRVYACGLGQAKSLRPQPDGAVLITDGPYLETKEHVGGFWILECADLDQAVAWARKGVIATRGQGEVREIFFQPAPAE